MSSKDKPITQSLYQTANRHWKRIMGSPAQQAAILALLAGGTTWMAYPLVKNTVKSMAQPFTGKAGQAGEAVQNAVFDNPKYEHLSRGAIALAAAGAAGWLSTQVTKQYRLPRGGSWSSFDTLNYEPLKKRSSYIPQAGPKMTDLLNTQATMDLFRNDPILSQYDPYARNMGTAIVANAGQGARNTSLGSIFDSAVDKIGTKLNMAGIANTALNATAAYATASLFTNAVGTMMGLPKQTRDNIISAGTWAGAISSILE